MVEKSMKYINAYDPEIARVLELELMRQRTHIELIASGIAGISSVSIIPYLYYPYLLLVCVILSILAEK